MSSYRDLLDQAEVPQLPVHAISALAAPLSQSEGEATLKDAPNGKEPGPDSLSIAYYKALSCSLSEHFLRAFNSITSGQTLPANTFRAQITLIPKDRKDPNDPKNDRSISLWNVDLKIFTQILASQLAPWVPSVMHWDQVCFVRSREARDGVIRVLNVIQVACKHKILMMPLLFDAEKAFDHFQ